MKQCERYGENIITCTILHPSFRCCKQRFTCADDNITCTILHPKYHVRGSKGGCIERGTVHVWRVLYSIA